MTWSHHEEWTTWSVENVIFDCDGRPDNRKWYSVVGAESDSEILSSLGGRPAGSRRSTALLPPGARYSGRPQKRCLHETLHASIPFGHKIETYYETGIFRIVCRAADAAFGWPLCPKSGPLKGKWDKSSLNCFYSAEAVYALMIGAVQVFQQTDGGGEIISAVGKCVAEVKCETKPCVVVGTRCPEADEGAIRAALAIFNRASSQRVHASQRRAAAPWPTRAAPSAPPRAGPPRV